MTGGKRKRVLILEMYETGHRPYQVRLVLDSGIAQFADIVLATQPDMLKHPAIATCTTPFQHYPIQMGSKFIREPNMSNAAAAIYYNWAIGRIYRNIYFAIARQAPLDCVLVPYLDNCLLSLALPMEAFGGTPWLALTMRTMLHYPEMHISAPPQKFAALRRRLFYRMLGQRSMTAVLTIDPTLAEYAAQQGGSLRKIHYVPDPVKFHGALPARADARRWLNIPDSARVVLLYGELSTRKGAVALVEAAASPECSKQIHIVVAGRNRALPDFMNSPACQQLSTERRISSINALIDNEQEKLLLALSDCMWVGYIDFYGVSGVMAQAGRHGLPVIASDSGLIGHFTRHHELGLVVDPHDRNSIVTALNRLVTEPELFARAARNGVAFFQNHDPSVLQGVWRDQTESAWT